MFQAAIHSNILHFNMSGKIFKGEYILRNILAIFVLVIFIVLELLYLKIIPNNFFNDSYKNIIGIISHRVTASDSEIALQENNAIENDDNDNLMNDDKYLDYKKINFDGNYKISTVSETYFDNTLFVGDSRMLGFSIFKQIPGATYYCYQSADAFTILDKEYDLQPYGRITLYNLLSIKRFDKIYISLGINNVAAGLANHKNHYKHLLDTIKNLQPNAIIYLLANLHVTSQLINDNISLNNDRINNINEFISEFEDKKQVFYLDPNVVYDDEFGNMDIELSYDNAHIYLRHYDRLYNFLITHAVVYDE